MSFDPTAYTRSRWMKSTDIEREYSVFTVSNAFEHEFRDGERKPVLSFSESDQQLPLNKTRVAAMITLFGTDPTRWIGRQVQLSTVPTHMGASIVINAAPAQPQPGPQQPQGGYGQTDETTPF